MREQPLDCRVLTVPANTAILDQLRGFVSEHAGRILSADRLDELVLAVDEAVANVVEHAYTAAELPADEQLIRVETELYHTSCHISVMDRGVPFDPASLPPVDLQAHYRAAKQDGLGVHMIRQLVDRWEYRSAVEADGAVWNCLTLIKNSG